MSKKPLITVPKEVNVRRSYSVPEEIAQDLEDYAAFLSEYSGAKVSSGDIIGKLAGKLGKDLLFVEWRKKRATAKATPAPARTAARESAQKGGAIGTRSDGAQKDA